MKLSEIPVGEMPSSVAVADSCIYHRYIQYTLQCMYLPLAPGKRGGVVGEIIWEGGGVIFVVTVCTDTIKYGFVTHNEYY